MNPPPSNLRLRLGRAATTPAPTQAKPVKAPLQKERRPPNFAKLINYGTLGSLGLVGAGLGVSALKRNTAMSTHEFRRATQFVSNFGHMGQKRGIGSFSIQDATAQLMTTINSVNRILAAFVTQQHVFETVGVEGLSRGFNFQLIKAIKDTRSILSINRWVLNALTEPRNVLRTHRLPEKANVFKRLETWWMNGPYHSFKQFGLNTPFPVMMPGYKQPNKPGEITDQALEGLKRELSFSVLEDRLVQQLKKLEALRPAYQAAEAQWERALADTSQDRQSLLNHYETLATQQEAFNHLRYSHDESHEYVGRYQRDELMEKLQEVKPEDLGPASRRLHEALARYEAQEAKNLNHSKTVDWANAYDAVAKGTADFELQALRHRLKMNNVANYLVGEFTRMMEDQSRDEKTGKLAIPEALEIDDFFDQQLREALKYYRPTNAFRKQFLDADGNFDFGKAQQIYVPVVCDLFRSLYESCFPELKDKGKLLDNAIGTALGEGALHYRWADTRKNAGEARAIDFNAASKLIARQIGKTDAPILLPENETNPEALALNVHGHFNIINQLRENQPEFTLPNHVRYFTPEPYHYRLPFAFSKIDSASIDALRQEIRDRSTTFYTQQKNDPTAYKRFVEYATGVLKNYVSEDHELYNNTANAPDIETAKRYAEVARDARSRHLANPDGLSLEKALREEFAKGRYEEKDENGNLVLKGHLFAPMDTFFNLNQRITDIKQFQRNKSIQQLAQLGFQALITAFILGNVVFFLVYNSFALLDADYRGEGKTPGVQRLIQKAKHMLGLGKPGAPPPEAPQPGPLHARVKLSVNFEKSLMPFRRPFEHLKRKPHLDNSGLYEELEKKLEQQPPTPPKQLNPGGVSP